MVIIRALLLHANALFELVRRLGIEFLNFVNKCRNHAILIYLSHFAICSAYFC